MQKTVHAGILMEQFFENGSYKEMKVTEMRRNEFRNALRQKLYDLDGNRHVFEDRGYVAKYIRKGKYKVDQIGMNEYLYNIGILPMVAVIDHKKVNDIKQLRSFLLPSEKDIGVSTNKLGRYSIVKLDIDEKMDANLMLDRFIYYDQKNNECKENYKKIKEAIKKCPILKQKEKITHKYGSVFLKEKRYKNYDIIGIINEFGPEFLIENAYVNEEKLNEFIQKGIIKRADLDQFKELVDYRIDFVVMSLESEAKSFSYLQAKQMAAIQTV